MQLHNGNGFGPGPHHESNGGHLHHGGTASSSRTIERILDEAQQTGELCISGRSMKEFPVSKHNLIDTSRADLSRNRFVEVPSEISQLVFLESLNCRENQLRAIPRDFARLTCLMELDISRNNVTTIPSILCKLPLQILLISHNRLTTLPAEMGQMKCLRELDVSCNEITHLPAQLGHIATLRRLDLRKNKLTQLPTDLKTLTLTYFDISENFITTLPTVFTDMTSLQTLHLSGNPLQSPPALLCPRGTIHVFKGIERSRRQPKDQQDLFSTRRIIKQPSSESSTNNGKASPLSPLASQFSLPIDSYTRSTNPSDNIYSVPQKVEPRTIPLSPSCPINMAKLSMHITTMTASSTDKSSTSSPSSSGVTDGASDEGVASMNGNGENSSDCDKEAARRKGINPISSHSQISRKTSPNQTVPTPNTARNNGVSHPGRTSAMKPPPASTTPRRLSSSGVTGLKEPLSATASTASESHSARNLPGRHSLQKIIPVKKDLVISTSTITKPRVHSALPRRGSVDESRSESVKESNPNFTIRRQQDQLREEAEKLEMLKKYIQTRLKLTLPDDVMESLQDGVMLCHLVNNIRPRSVISIHVPPNTQSGLLKLTPAKSRRNVENFLDACRRLGVPEVVICSSADILECKSPSRVCGCVNGLIQLEANTPKRGQPAGSVLTPRILSAGRAQTLRDFSAV